MEVFVSWRGSDRAVKNEIVKALREGLGPDVLVWESDEYCVSKFSEECMKAIRRCDVFIVLISEAAMEPSYVINEVTEAHQMEMQGKLNMMVYRLTDAPYTEEFAGELNHVSDANHVSRLEGRDDGPAVLVRKVQYLLDRRKRGDPVKPNDVFVPVIEGTSIARTGYFVENSRDDVFAEIDEAFAHSNVVIASQLTGYGRRCALRKYLEIHADTFRKVITFPFFSGTLQEFFARGLVITNINESVFEGLDDRQLIQKKTDLLKKLGEETILLVPNVVFGGDLDSFVFDILAGLKCRFAFVTQQVSSRVRDIYPVVSVGKMQNRYLLDLFFHNYGGSVQDSSPELVAALEEFFDSVDGHTKTVELTAVTLADEYDVYPEDIPGILAQIGQNGEEELPNRITAMISELFDIRDFTDKQKKTLLAAALLAETPMDLKEFISVLENCGCYDRETLRGLDAARWLDLNRTGRTIAMERFLGKVCLEKLAGDQNVQEVCLFYMKERLEEDLLMIRLGVLPVTLRRAKRFFSLLGQRTLTVILSVLQEQIQAGSGDCDKLQIQKLCRMAVSEAEQLGSESCDEVEDLIDFLQGVIQSLSMFEQIESRKRDSSLEDSLIADRLLEFSGSVNALIGENNMPQDTIPAQISPAQIFLRKFEKMVDRGLYGGGVQTVCQEYLELTAWFVNHIGDDELDELLCVLLLNLGLELSSIVSGNPYLVRQICHNIMRVIDAGGCLFSFVSYYSLLIRYFEALVILGEDTEDLDEVYEALLEVFEKVKKDFYSDEREAERNLQGFRSAYLDLKLKFGYLEEADQILRQMFAVRVKSMETLCMRAADADKFVSVCIQEGETELARAFLEEVPIGIDLQMLRDYPDREESQEAVAALESLEEISAAFIRGGQSLDFGDQSSEYVDYYRTYAAKPADKKKMHRYEVIAEKALTFDFSELSEEELRQRAVSLRSKIHSAGKWESFAPEAFALTSEAGSRVLGYRLHLVQMIGAAAIFDGNIAEIQNGEGKTYTIVPAAYLHVLCGRKVSILDWSDYLTERNYIWMRGLFEMLGCSVECDSSKYKSRSEAIKRKECCDVLYATVESRIFLSMRSEYTGSGQINPSEKAVRWDSRERAVIVDEADQAMITRGATPCILFSNEKIRDNLPLLHIAAGVVSKIKRNDGDIFTYKKGAVTLHSGLYRILEKEAGHLLSPDNTAVLENMIRIGIMVRFFWEKDRDYYIYDHTCMVEDTSSGSFVQADKIVSYFVGQKEQLPELTRNMKFDVYKPLDHFGVREYLLRFGYLSGVTATASDLAEEFRKYYGLEVFPVPTNVPVIRKDYSPLVFSSIPLKHRAILELIKEKHETGQPVLAITSSVEESEQIYAILRQNGINAVLLNAKNADQEAEELGKAGLMGRVTVTTSLANRGVDICLGGNPSIAARDHLLRAGKDRKSLEKAISGLQTVSTEIRKLRREYDNLCALYYRQMHPEREKVESLGGLCVIGTTCFEHLRTEQQMRGRCGRQGSPGESYVYYSVKDETFQILLGNLAGAMDRLLRGVDGSLESTLLTNRIKTARLRLQHYRSRQLENMPEMLYYRDARKQLKDIVISEKELSRFLRTHFETEAEDYKERLKDCQENGMTRWAGWLQFLSPEQRSRLAVLPQRKLPAALYVCFTESLQQSESFQKVLTVSGKSQEAWICHMIQLTMQDAWSKYLMEMETEIASAGRVYHDEKRRKAHLDKFSALRVRNLHSDAVDKVLQMVFRIRVR